MMSGYGREKPAASAIKATSTSEALASMESVSISKRVWNMERMKYTEWSYITNYTNIITTDCVM